MEYIGPLFKLVLLSILIERFLAVFFDLAGVKEKLQANVSSSTLPSGQARKFSFKGLIAAGVGILVCVTTGYEVVNSILLAEPKMLDDDGKNLINPLEPVLAQIITGVIIAGGSQGSVKLFQDILGFSKDNRDILKETSLKQQEAAQIRAKAEKMAAEVEHLKNTNALRRLTTKGSDEPPSPVEGVPFDAATEVLMGKIITEEERTVLRHVAKRLVRRSRG